MNGDPTFLLSFSVHNDIIDILSKFEYNSFRTSEWSEDEYHYVGSMINFEPSRFFFT